MRGRCRRRNEARKKQNLDEAASTRLHVSSISGGNPQHAKYEFHGSFVASFLG
jgi:hypothetical protein